MASRTGGSRRSESSSDPVTAHPTRGSLHTHMQPLTTHCGFFPRTSSLLFTACGLCAHQTQVVKGEGAGALLTGLGPTAFGYFIQVRRARRCSLCSVVVGRWHGLPHAPGILGLLARCAACCQTGDGESEGARCD
jgi:hypothetical protein